MEEKAIRWMKCIVGVRVAWEQHKTEKLWLKRLEEKIEMYQR